MNSDEWVDKKGYLLHRCLVGALPRPLRRLGRDPLPDHADLRAALRGLPQEVHDRLPAACYRHHRRQR